MGFINSVIEKFKIKKITSNNSNEASSSITSASENLHVRKPIENKYDKFNLQASTIQTSNVDLSKIKDLSTEYEGKNDNVIEETYQEIEIPSTDINETGFVPQAYLDPDCPEKGMTLEFSSIHGSSMYVPYNIEEMIKNGEKVNVVIAYAGGGAPTNYLTDAIFKKVYYYNGKQYSVEYSPSDMYDNMIYYGLTEPFILISVPYNLDRKVAKTIDGQILANDYLPKIVDALPTYAKDSSPESIMEANEHFAVLTFSDGTHTYYSSGLEDCSDFIPNCILCSGGCQGGLDNPPESLRRVKANQKKLDHLYVAVGGDGDNVPWHQESYQVAVDAFGGEDNLECEYEVFPPFSHCNEVPVEAAFVNIPRIWDKKKDDFTTIPETESTIPETEEFETEPAIEELKKEKPYQIPPTTKPIEDFEPIKNEHNEDNSHSPESIKTPIIESNPIEEKNNDNVSYFLENMNLDNLSQKLNLDLVGGKGLKTDTITKEDNGYRVVKHYKNGYEADIFIPLTFNTNSNVIVDSSRGNLTDGEKKDDSIIINMSNTILSKRHKGIYATYDIYHGKTDEEMHAFGYEGSSLSGFYMPFEKESMKIANEIIDSLQK